MEPASPKDEKNLDLIRQIEAIGNREVDTTDGPRRLLAYLEHEDPEVVLTALHASGSFVGESQLFQTILTMARSHPDEEIRGMANSCLGNVLHDGLEFQDDLPDEAQVPEPQVDPEFYRETRDFLLERVDAPMESMEVRRRALEALGHLGWQPEVREIILRFYHQAPNPWVKVSALYAMSLVHDPVFERLVLEELHNPNEHVVVEAIHASGILQLPSAEDRLMELTGSEIDEIAYEAIVALGQAAPLGRLPDLLVKIENPSLSKEIREALDQAQESYRQRLMLEKGEPIWDDQAVLSEIDSLVNDSNPD
jgi:HEAT repeat protein